MAWNQPGSNKPPGNKPAGSKPAGNKPAANKPAGNKSGKKPDDSNGQGGPAGMPPGLDEALKKLAGVFGGLHPGAFLAGALAALLAGAAVSGFQQVDAGEQAVVFRLGKLRAVEGPGLHWYPPMLDRVSVINVAEIRQATLTPEVMLADESLAGVTLTLQYRIAEPRDYLQQQADTEALLLRLGESVLREVAANSAQADLSGEKAVAMSAALQTGLQSALSRYRTGLELKAVTLSEAGLPDAVKPSQEAAQRIHDDARRQELDAASAAGKKLAEARAAAERQLADADVYRTKAVSEAQRDLRDFNQTLNDYRRDPAGTEQKLRDDALRKLLSGRQVVLVDDKRIEALRLPDGRTVPGIALPAPVAPEKKP